MSPPLDTIIDCDPGIDDALALMLAAASPELHLLGVSCVAGNRPVPQTTRNAARVLAAAGCAQVPVHAGCARPLAHALARCNLVHGEDGLGGAALPEGRAPEALHATDYLAQALLQSAPNSITLIAVGPLTNLALAEIKHPGVLQRAKAVLVMGGAAFRRGNITPQAEFNFHADALAAHVVLGAGAALSVFGLDVTEQAVMSKAWIASLATLDSRCAQAAHAMLSAYASKESLLHDACPVAFAIEPALFSGARHELSVDWQEGPSEGRLHAVRPSPGQTGNAQLITGVDGDRLLSLVRERIARLP
jgi:purine nucleosidase